MKKTGKIKYQKKSLKNIIKKDKKVMSHLQKKINFMRDSKIVQKKITRGKKIIKIYQKRMEIKLKKWKNINIE